MEMPKRYKILVSKDAMQDIQNTKEYILNTFHYRAYAENFSKKIREAIEKLEPFPFACEDAECSIEGFKVYYRPYSTYIIFFVVDGDAIIVVRVLKDRMYWKAILNRMKHFDL